MTRDQRNSIKRRIILLNILIAGMTEGTHVCLPPKLPLPLGGSGHPSNTNGISIGSAVFAGFIPVKLRQTTPQCAQQDAASVCHANGAA